MISRIILAKNSILYSNDDNYLQMPPISKVEAGRCANQFFGKADCDARRCRF